MRQKIMTRRWKVERYNAAERMEIVSLRGFLVAFKTLLQYLLRIRCSGAEETISLANRSVADFSLGSCFCLGRVLMLIPLPLPKQTKRLDPT